ncbi:hypothetical protein MFIFM68171_01180 [Madurella fahalii]|uniref:RING-type domain-containing protein n=1 Tax=Madurella fahalii TaxID=1157608 RepID=A0ABQ0FZQ1_9PEZI
MIEHSSGCYHMNCHCGHEFCYLCGKTWRSCRCPSYMTELEIVLGKIPWGNFEVDARRETTRSLERHWRAMLECEHPTEGWLDDYDGKICMLCGTVRKAR